MFQSLLARLAQALDGACIPYMIIGGQAVLLHGEPRLTRGIDITPGVDNRALSKVLEATGAIGLTPAVVDLIFSFTPYETGALSRAVSVPVAGVTVRFAAVEDLVIHKLVAGRPRDLEDVRGVLARHPRLDEEYLQLRLASFRAVVDRDLVDEYRSLKHE